MTRPLLMLVMVVAFLIAGPVTAQADRTTAAGSPSDMLETVLPAVLTIAVEANDLPLAYGFSDETTTRTAYRRNLDLGGYASSGSGFVVMRAGEPYVITNAHVIQGSGDGALHGYSLDRTRYALEIVGADSYRDVAVLRFLQPLGPEVGSLEIRPGNLRIAEPVYAVGNPLGELPYSVSAGIVSGLNRTLTGFTGREGYVQTDAVVAGGNSGGPLIGLDGHVVGLVTQGLTAAPINFALEAEHLSRFVDDIIRDGRVQRAHLGILLQERESASGTANVVLASTLTDGPAAEALAPYLGWSLVAVDGQEVVSLSDALPLVEGLTPGEEVELVVAREGQRPQPVTVPTAALTEEASARFARAMIRQFVEVDVRDAGAGVQVVSAPPGEAIARMSVHPIRSSSRAPMQPGETIVGAGYYSGESSTFWRTPSLHELGVALRLVMRTGWIGTLIEDPEGGWRVVDVRIPASAMI